MIPNNKAIENTITRFLAGEASTEEKKDLERWLSDDVNNELLFTQIKSYWQADLKHTDEINYNRVYNLTKNRIQHTQSALSNNKFSTHKKYKYLISSFAAIALLAILYLGLIKQTVQHTYTYVSGSSVSVVNLADGSTVTLNKNSKLTYDNDYNKNTRSISIEGEAYLEIKHSPEKKFIVNIDNAKITVLGTIFNVRNREGRDIEAALIEGKIQFDTPYDNVLLSPGQEVLYNRSNKTLSVRERDVESIVAWKDNQIIYRSKSLREVVELLENHYNVKIKLNAQNIDQDVITGSFDGDLPIENILSMIKENTQFEWKKTPAGYEISDVKPNKKHAYEQIDNREK